jgi:hypothetical protein
VSILGITSRLRSSIRPQSSRSLVVALDRAPFVGQCLCNISVWILSFSHCWPCWCHVKLDFTKYLSPLVHPPSSVLDCQDVQRFWLDAKTQAVRRIPKSMPRPPPFTFSPGVAEASNYSIGQGLSTETILRASLEMHWKAAARTTVASAWYIKPWPFVFLLETLVNTYDSGSSPLSLTSILVVSQGLGALL